MPFPSFAEQLKKMEGERLLFGRARKIAQLQSDLVLAEQSLVYGEAMCKDITMDLQTLDTEFEALKKECNEHKGDPEWAEKYKRAKAAHEMGIMHHAEERIGIIREMDTAKGRIASIKAKLSKEGAAPKQQTMEEATFGARMAMMTRLPGAVDKYKGFGSADNFGFTCAAKHLMHSEDFEKNAKAAEQAGNVRDFTHNLASATFYATASHMLMDMRVSSPNLALLKRFHFSPFFLTTYTAL
jgi:hypothetical protein